MHVPIDDSVLTGGRETDEAEDPPAFAHVLGILLLPLVLIAGNTILTTLRANGSIDERGRLVDALVFIGQTPVALLIALLVATYTLAIRRHSRDEIEGLLNDALGPICAIILITGAGGMFGGVLRYSGIGDALSDSLADLGLPLIVSAFVIATDPARRAGFGDRRAHHHRRAALRRRRRGRPAVLQLVALVLAIAAGATVLSHVNDSGLLAGQPVLRDGREDHAAHLDGARDDARAQSIFVLALGVWAIG